MVFRYMIFERGRLMSMILFTGVAGDFFRVSVNDSGDVQLTKSRNSISTDSFVLVL